METTFQMGQQGLRPLLINRPYINLEEERGFFWRYNPNAGGPDYRLYTGQPNKYRSFLL